MKQQTFILSMQNSEGEEKDFYRFSHKRAKTCLNELKKAAAHSSLFCTLWKADKIENIVLFATPDGYNKENIVFSCNLWEFLEGKQC